MYKREMMTVCYMNHMKHVKVHCVGRMAKILALNLGVLKLGFKELIIPFSY
jgi:hypothetical protein